jgi:hypothetical protein
MDHKIFKKHWAGHLKVCLDPCTNFVTDLKKKSDDGLFLEVSKLSAGTRTTLVLCSERLVESLNIMGFRGRIIQTVWKELSHPLHAEHKNCFVLPATCLLSVAASRCALLNPKIAQPTQAPQVEGECPRHAAVVLLRPWMMTEVPVVVVVVVVVVALVVQNRVMNLWSNQMEKLQSLSSRQWPWRKKGKSVSHCTPW